MERVPLPPAWRIHRELGRIGMASWIHSIGLQEAEPLSQADVTTWMICALKHRSLGRVRAPGVTPAQRG
jgi:hypothetical protein